MAAMIVITMCVYLLKVIEATTGCNVLLSTDSNIVQSGSNVSLTCRVCRISERIEFYHNDSLLFYRAAYGRGTILNITLLSVNTSVDNDVTTLTLTILTFLETSQGSYTCKILYTDRTTDIANQFMVLSVPVTSVNLYPENNVLNVVEGRPIFYIECISSLGRPSPDITWYLDSGTQDTYLDDVNISMSANVSTSNGATKSTLALTPLNEVNNQSIYCNVSNGYSVISSQHRLRLNIITYPSRPIIKYSGKQITDVYIIKGRNMSFECSSLGEPPPDIIWKTPLGEFINNTVLKIPMQNGLYTCSARSILSPSKGDQITATNTSVFSVNILYPPEVILCTIGAQSIVPSSVVKVILNEPFAIDCNSDGNPPPTYYTWVMPNGSLSSEKKLEFPFVKSIGNNSYTLRVSNKMNGTFDTEITVGTLTATYTFDILYSPKAPDLYYKSSTEMLINKAVIHVIKGRNVCILCKASSNPDPTYNWFVSDIQKPNASILNTTIQNNTRVQCYVSNTMHATGQQSVNTSSNSSVTLIAMFGPGTPTMTFYDCGMHFQTNYLKVIQGHSVNGTCTTYSNPPSTYSWIPDTFGSANSFFINASHAGNSGNYTCTVANKMPTTFDGIIEENTNSSFRLDILVPVDVQSIANATVVLNSTFSVACPYTKDSQASVSLTWIHNGTTRNTGTGQTLALPFIKLTDEGYYTCKVFYRLEPSICAAVEDYDESTFYLDVQYAAKINRFNAVGFSWSSQSITINESQSVSLICEVESDPVAYMQVINTTRGSEHLLKQLHNNTIFASIDDARCEYDMGVYKCKGNNTHNVVEQVRSIEILINCAPRPSPFSPLNTTFYRKTNDSVIITFNVVAYPLPNNLKAYIWKKRINYEWVTLHNSSGFIIHISNDRLQTNLSKLQLNIDDFTNFTVRVNNDIGSWEQTFVIRANEQPSSPEQYEVAADLVTENSVTIEWKPGFDGGEKQKFVILYRKATDKTWTNTTLSGAITRSVIDGLSPGTAYEFKMYAENTIGKSDETAVQHVVTKSYSAVTETTKQCNMEFLHPLLLLLPVFAR